MLVFFIAEYKMTTRLGYHAINITLRDKHITTNRTARAGALIEKVGRTSAVKHMKELYLKNMHDLLEVIRWNIKHKIFVYRISSSVAPHITNPMIIPKNKHNDPSVMAYPIELAQDILSKIGELAREYNMRITFHPGQHTVLSSANPEIIVRSMRDLYYHASMLRAAGLASIPDGGSAGMVIHGGGVYGHKRSAIERWVANYRALPKWVREYIILENDEKSYSAANVLAMSKAVRQQTGVPVPILFDIFHYECHGERTPIEKLIPAIIRTWPRGARLKMHISEQRPGSPRGAHSDYIHSIPPILRNFGKLYGRGLDLMIEAKMHEKAVLYLRKKYPQLR